MKLHKHVDRKLYWISETYNDGTQVTKIYGKQLKRAVDSAKIKFRNLLVESVAVFSTTTYEADLNKKTIEFVLTR